MTLFDYYNTYLIEVVAQLIKQYSFLLLSQEEIEDTLNRTVLVVHTGSIY